MLPDADLLDACRRGDPLAWDALVERYARLVWSVARRNGLPESDADEAMQATFIQLHRRLETLRDDAKLSSWLITTAHRESWRVARARRPAVEADESVPSADDPGTEQVERWERQHAVHEALRTLGGRCETLLRALFLAGDRPDYEKVAASLDMPIGSIGPTRARCFEKLRVILERLGHGADES